MYCSFFIIVEIMHLKLVSNNLQYIFVSETSTDMKN